MAAQAGPAIAAAAAPLATRATLAAYASLATRAPPAEGCTSLQVFGTQLESWRFSTRVPREGAQRPTPRKQQHAETGGQPSLTGRQTDRQADKRASRQVSRHL